MTTVAFIGAGNMNSAIISGMVKQGFPAQDIWVTNPSASKREALAKNLGINQCQSNLEAVALADYVVLGVKPHFINEVCTELASQIDISQKCFLSVAAGATIQQMQSYLGDDVSVIRTMPNTPAQLGLGVTGIYAAPNVTEEQKSVADQLMKATGVVKWVESEKDIDKITAISGSGPAYFFLFMESMQAEAQAMGFSEQDSREIVQQVALGAAQMVKQNDITIANLRENVTSKGGTTQAALDTFRAGELPQLVTKAMQSALNRAGELAQNN